MFWKGLLFALGFIAGCLVFSFLLLAVAVVLETSLRLFRKKKQTDETIDIRQWQQRRSIRKSIPSGFRPAS